MLITMVLAGLREGFVVVPTEVILAWEGKRDPGLGSEGDCEQESLSLCLERGWLCPGAVWPRGAEGFLLPPSALHLAGNTSPPCPGSDQFVCTESSWHCCYNSRAHFSVFSRPIHPYLWAQGQLLHRPDTRGRRRGLKHSSLFFSKASFQPGLFQAVSALMSCDRGP